MLVVWGMTECIGGMERYPGSMLLAFGDMYFGKHWGKDDEEWDASDEADAVYAILIQCIWFPC